MSDKAYVERRRHERVTISVYIDWGFNASCVRQGRITSLSVGGCFVQTKLGAERGQTVFIRMALPEERLLRGEVRYWMPDVGFGVMFVDVTIEEQLTLESLVEHYKKQQTEGGKQ